MKYILALDQGTSSSRAIVFDQEGAAVAAAQKEVRSTYPEVGWVEQDPDEIWKSQLAAAQEAIAQSKISKSDLGAIGITNQRETTILWEKRTGRPLCNAIVWQCRRTAPLCEELKSKGVAEIISGKTGLLLDAYFSATKIKWVLDQVPGARILAGKGELCFGTVDSWLIHKLTKGELHLTDVSNASRTALLNLQNQDWDGEILSLLDIPDTILPKIRSSSELYGETAKNYFGRSIPIAGVAGDQQASLFGQAAFQPGVGKNTYGTGCFLLTNIGDAPIFSHAGLLTTIAWKVGPRTTYALEGSIFIAGAAVQWLRDNLGIISSAADVEPLAAEVTSSDGVYFVPAFVGLGAPHWDMYARGTLVGLTRGTRRAHIARATLESIAFQSRDVLEIMEQESGARITELRVDGGAARNDLLMQIQANILGRPIVRPANTETTALGAAYLAGLGIGLWKDTADIASRWKIGRRFVPQIEPSQKEEMYNGWKNAVERAKSWAKKPGSPA